MEQDYVYRRVEQLIGDYIEDEFHYDEYCDEYDQSTPKKELFLGHIKLSKVPEKIGNLKSLTLLDLSENYLTEIPPELGKLVNLYRLFLEQNQLCEIPAELGQLRNLEELNLADNKLSKIPVELGQLANLKELNLAGNQLNEIPGELGQLPALSMLYLDDNPLHPELEVAYSQGFSTVVAYLRAQAQAEIVLNEAKLILIGEGEVGKTSLLGALRGDEWIEGRPTTHGVEVNIKPLAVTSIDGVTDVTLNGWDFGGQNIYRYTHQLFFTAPAIYLAIWNPRRGPEQCRVDEWIKMVKHRAYDETRPDAQPRILVIATHGGPKERLDHIDEQALRDEFGDLLLGFHHVDSKTEYGLDELKKLIAHSASKIPQVGRTVPVSWKRVLDEIRQLSVTNAWITYEEFQTLCARQGVDVSLAKTYATILNELGHLIHYATDPALQDTIILRPEWLSKAISFVLEDKQVKEQNGLVCHSRLSQLWDDPAREADRYPPHLHPLFLKLMERFDLSYQVELPEVDAPATSLMAQLVPSKRPDDWAKFWVHKPGDTECTYICRILDRETGRTIKVEGLMYRLIVRLHRYSLGRHNYYESRHWKNGLLLDNGFNGRAFIEEISGDIYVTVRAAYPNGFLGHLCSEIAWLVTYFWKGLDPRLYIPCPTDNCRGLLERDEIIEFKSQGMPKVRCTLCKAFHEIDELMVAATAKPEWQNAVAELKQGQQQILTAFDQGFDTLSLQLKILMSQADEQFEVLLNMLTDPAKDGPRLFSFEPIDPGFWDKPKWVAQKFRLTLWCEHRRLPLPLLNGEGDNRGVYEIELTRDWIKRASPLLRILSVTLKLTLPIAVPGTKLATDEAEYSAIAEQLEFGIQSANSFLSGSDQVRDWLIDGNTSNFDQPQTNRSIAIRAQGSILRELHSLLKAQDPANSFGGLERVRNKRQEFLWVHSSFINEY